VYQNKNEFTRAMNYFNKCLEYKSDYADAHFAKATIELLLGDFENGWKDYEYRWDQMN
jgi:tetratricopeptide (TPR) repeat protein